LKQKNKEILLLLSQKENKNDENKTIELDRTKNMDYDSKDLLFSPIIKQKKILTNDNNNNNNNNDHENNFKKFEKEKILIRQSSNNTNALYNEMSIYADNKSEYVEPIVQKAKFSISIPQNLEKNNNSNNNRNDEGKYKVR